MTHLATRQSAATIPDDVLARAAALKASDLPFVLATVVWSQRPTSARPGAKGLVTPDGAIFGWVGGSCAQPTVVREALRALEEGAPRLLRLDPDGRPDPARADLVVAPLTCHSGGKLEIFLEPFLPRLQLAVVGESPVADALVQLGRLVGYRVVAVRPAASAPAPEDADEVVETLDLAPLVARGRTVAVVASMGIYDEDAVEAALRAGAAYVALVASRRRYDELLALLHDSGLEQDTLARLKAPAGLDISATSAEEIAVSIVAEIIARRATWSAVQPVPSPTLKAREPEFAIDPVCGMSVEVTTARYVSEHAGVHYYFCCPACRRAFERDPARYVSGT